MPYANSNGVRLYYEEVGRGTPLVFVHEFADDLYSWEAQLRYFSRRYRCIAFNARGYPPSDVPQALSRYSQAIATDDIASVMRHLKISKAHLIGCSMGGYATIHFGLRYARLALSLTAVGGGARRNPRPPGRKQAVPDRPGARAVPERGPARFRPFLRRIREAFGARLCEHAARRAGTAPDRLQPRARTGETQGTAARGERRRGG